jgi:hypothetical protein
MTTKLPPFFSIKALKESSLKLLFVWFVAKYSDKVIILVPSVYLISKIVSTYVCFMWHDLWWPLSHLSYWSVSRLWLWSLLIPETSYCYQACKRALWLYKPLWTIFTSVHLARKGMQAQNTHQCFQTKFEMWEMPAHAGWEMYKIEKMHVMAV